MLLGISKGFTFSRTCPFKMPSFLPPGTDQFHVVDERVAVLPGLHTVAAQGPRGDHLQVIQYIKGTVSRKITGVKSGNNR